MQKLVERVNDENELDGRVHTYNLFSLCYTEYRDTIATFEKLVSLGDTSVMDDYPSLDELKKHPWFCKYWGINNNTNRSHLRVRENKWIELLANANVSTFGKLHPNKLDYFHLHIRPRLQMDHEVYQDELVELFRKELAGKLHHN